MIVEGKPGNGAMEVLARYFAEYDPVTMGITHFLGWLWENGYKVVPLDDDGFGD